MELNMICQKQIANLVVTPTVFSGTNNVYALKIELDETWNEYEHKSAVFYTDIEKPYYVEIKDNTCIVPAEVMKKKSKVNVGVFGTKDDKIMTSQVVRFDVGQGAVSEELIPPYPTLSMWELLLQRYDDILDKTKNIYQDQEDFIKTVEEDQTAFKQEIKADQEQFVNDTNIDREEYQRQWNERVDGSLKEMNNALLNVNDALTALDIEKVDMDGGTPSTEFEEGDYIDANGGYPV